MRFYAIGELAVMLEYFRILAMNLNELAAKFAMKLSLDSMPRGDFEPGDPVDSGDEPTPAMLPPPSESATWNKLRSKSAEFGSLIWDLQHQVHSLRENIALADWRKTVIQCQKMVQSLDGIEMLCQDKIQQSDAGK